MALRPSGAARRGKGLQTDSRGCPVATLDWATEDWTSGAIICDTLTASTVTANLVGNVSGSISRTTVTGNLIGGITATSGFIKVPPPVVSTANAVLTAAQSGGTWVAT